MGRFVPAAALGLALFLPHAAAAKPPLHEEPTVRAMFYAIGLADEVRKNCDAIAPRMIRAYTYLRSIEAHARRQGYGDAEIEALVENKAEKERLRARIRADLAQRGAVPGDPTGYCEVGRDEIAQGTASGRLLREN